ncbi:hypothetical protein PFISCL1PPCAC_27387, partial [Pristionchus fissidentatus]
LEHPEEGCHGSNIEGVSCDAHDMVLDTSQLAEEGSNVLCTGRNVDAEQFLNRERPRLLVAHHGDVVQTIHVRESLRVGLVLDEFLSRSMQKTNVRNGFDDNLSFQFENESEHSVSCGMLRSEVENHVLENLLTFLPIESVAHHRFAVHQSLQFIQPQLRVIFSSLRVPQLSQSAGNLEFTFKLGVRVPDGVGVSLLCGGSDSDGHPRMRKKKTK